jgi:double-stranded uracil-DNA glycosylase
VNHNSCLQPVSRSDAKVLFLGTLPGTVSISRREYYAQPINAFWRIISAIIGSDPGVSYEHRCRNLIANKIALWDVCASARRAGSLDSSILDPVPNDFNEFFIAHKKIELICFNGKTAERLYTRTVFPNLSEDGQRIQTIALPSTSSANARVRFEQKLDAWKRAFDTIS